MEQEREVKGVHEENGSQERRAEVKLEHQR